MSPILIRAQVQDILRSQLATPRDIAITDDKRLALDLGADSMDVVEVVMYLEDAFDIVITDEDAEKFQTVGDVVKYVSEKLNG